MGKPKDRDFPTRRDLDRLLEKLGPDLARLFAERGIKAAEAQAWVRDALLQLAFRWSKVQDRERWLLEAVERAIREGPHPPGRKPRTQGDRT